MFDNIKSLRLMKDPYDMTIATAMISSEGEIMEFRYNGKLFTEQYHSSPHLHTL